MPLLSDNKKAVSNSKGNVLLVTAFILILTVSLITMGLFVFGPLSRRGKVTSTLDILESSVQAIISWSAGNNRIPDSSGTGNPTDFRNIAKDPNDSYGKTLYYIYDNNLTSVSTGGLCGRNTTNLSVRFCPDAGCSSPSNVIPNAAFIILSGGPNYNNQTAATQGISTSTTINVYDASVLIDNYTGDANRAEPYDDIVRVVTLNELKSRAGCAGMTIGRLAILNNELPKACVSQVYTASLYPDGGVPNSGAYQWCIQGALPAGITANPGTACPAWSSGAATLTLSGIAPGTAGSYPVTFMLRDNDAVPNVVQRNLPINVVSNCGPVVGPPGGGGTGGINTQPPGDESPDSTALSENIVTNTPGGESTITVQNNVINFGSNVNNGAACVWYPNNFPLLGKTMRAYWNFIFDNIDTSPGSTTYADGYTFVLMQGSNATTYCGTGTPYDAVTNPRFDCSNASHFGEFLSYCGLAGQSIALEFDIYPSTERNDPTGNYNHVAIVKSTSTHITRLPAGTYGDNTHNVGGNPPCNGTSQACIFDNFFGNQYPVTWMENNQTHNVRTELHTRCNSDCSACEQPTCTTRASLRVWIDKGDNNLNFNKTVPASDMTYCFDLPAEMNQVKVGFTQGTGASVQLGQITNLMAIFDGGCSQPAITTASLPNGFTNVPYSVTMSGSGGTTPYTWSGQNLPPGLSINSSGIISGTPTTTGTYNIILVSLTDSCTTDVCSNTVSKSYNIQVQQLPQPSCTLSANPTLVHNSTTNFTWTITNGPADGTWGTAPGGTCSNFTNSTGGTCTSGNITNPGNNIFTLTVNNAGGSNSCSATVTNCPPLSITTTSLPGGRRNIAYTPTTVTASGGITPFSWSATGLPAGLTIGASTGTISGTPTVGGLFNPTVTVADSCPTQQSANQTYSLAIKFNTYSIVNNTGATIYRQVGGTCTNANRITSGNSYSIAYNAGAVTFYQNRNSSNNCLGNSISISGPNADAADLNYNGNVGINSSWQLVDQ